MSIESEHLSKAPIQIVIDKLVGTLNEFLIWNIFDLRDYLTLMNLDTENVALLVQSYIAKLKGWDFEAWIKLL